MKNRQRWVSLEMSLQIHTDSRLVALKIRMPSRVAEIDIGNDIRLQLLLLLHNRLW